MSQACSQDFFRSIADFLFIKMGRPRWFLDAEITQLLLHSKIESVSLEGITFPFDSFNLVFEKGIKLPGDWEPKYISVCNPRSALAAKLGGEPMQEFGRRFTNHPFADSFYIGGIISLNGKDTISLSVLPLSMPIRDGLEIINRPENKIIASGGSREALDSINDQIVKIALAAILYFNARPDLYVAQTLSRDQRFRFSGDAEDRKNMRRVLLPLEKKVATDQDAAPVGTGATKKPHYRGFVLRTLRSPRYERNPNGSLKTILVEPTVIHPELMEHSNG